MKSRAGDYQTNLKGELQYQSFRPAPLPPDPPLLLDEEAVSLLSKASRALGMLEGVSRQIPNIALFVSMYVRKEALLSSQIEGTQASLDDILDPHIDINANQNVAEVINYVKASQYASGRLHTLPICNRLLKETHAVLMSGIRGGEKNPGEFRTSQNWIGPFGSTLKNARYIPPNPLDMAEAMSDLEKFINGDDELDPLLKIGLIHYQFETIHPFLDGNGRIGRQLITLYLMEKGLLSHETLYISYFLKRNRIEYYDRLNEVRIKGNFEQWIKFFLRAVYESAQDALNTIDDLIRLHEKHFDAIKTTGKSVKTIIKVFEYLERSPIIEIKKTSQELDLAFNTVSNAVTRLAELGILSPVRNVRRSRIFAYDDYLAILRKNT